MPTGMTVTSNYEGAAAGAIIGKAFKEADTLSKNLVTIAPGVNYKLNMRRIRYTNGVTAYACGHTPAGAIVLDERVLQTVKAKNDFDVCKEDFRATWSDPRMGDSAWNATPADIQAAILAEVLGEMAEYIDNVIWNGATGTPGQWDGFTVLFAADGSVVKPTPAGAVTKANVLTALELVDTSIPIPIKRKDLVWAISPDVETHYRHSLIDAGITNGLGGNANTGLVYGRYGLNVVNGLAANTIIVYERKNLVFGTGLTADHNRVALVDEDQIGLLTGQVRGKMVYNGAVQYYNSEDIVYYVGA